jgi:hypothetical protein
LVFPHSNGGVVTHGAPPGIQRNRHDDSFDFSTAGKVNFLPSPEAFQNGFGFIPKIDNRRLHCLTDYFHQDSMSTSNPKCPIRNQPPGDSLKPYKKLRRSSFAVVAVEKSFCVPWSSCSVLDTRLSTLDSRLFAAIIGSGGASPSIFINLYGSSFSFSAQQPAYGGQEATRLWSASLKFQASRLRFASLAPASVALRAASGRLPGQHPLARVQVSAFSPAFAASRQLSCLMFHV